MSDTTPSESEPWRSIVCEGGHQAFMGERARNDALRDFIADLPDPATVASFMPLHLVQALCGAYQHIDGWRVHDEHAAALRPYGLVEYGGGRGLTAFGYAVRRILLWEDA